MIFCTFIFTVFTLSLITEQQLGFDGWHGMVISPFSQIHADTKPLK